MINVTVLTKSLLTVGILAILLSCANSDEDDGELDMPISKNQEAVQIKVNPKISWKKFFSPPPNPVEFANLQKKLRQWPDDDSPSNLIKKARAQVMVGQMHAAEATYRQLLRADSQNIPGHIELAQLYLRTGELERCLSYLQRGKEIFDAQEAPQEDLVFQYRYTLALAYIKQGDEKKGHHILSELISINKTFTPAYAAMASSYLKRNKLDTAEFIAKRGLDRGHEDARLTNLLGVIAFKKNRLVEAKRWYDRALKSSPNFVPALINRASLSIMRSEYEAADMDLGRAIGLNPIHAEAHIIQGILHKRTGDYKQSELSFKKAIEIEPENGFARYNLGVLKAEFQGEYGEALRLFNEVLQVDHPEERLKDLARMSIESLQQNRLQFSN